MFRRPAYGSLLLLTTLLFSCHGEETPPVDPKENQEVTTVKVAIVLPASEKEELSQVIDWAQENIREAQKEQKSRIELSLEWIDEEGPGLAQEVIRVTHDASYAAIIGPEYSANARLLARESLSYRIPVLMPMVTSTEFQRIYSESNKRDPNIFCLAQDDLAQCEAILNKAIAYGAHAVSILSRDGKKDDYAASFQQFFTFLALERGIPVDVSLIYDSADEILPLLRENYEDWDMSETLLLFVPSSTEDMLAFDQAVTTVGGKLPRLFCTDIAHEPSLQGKLKGGPYEGFSLGAEEGFADAWKARYRSTLPGGYAQLYDCLYLVATAAVLVQEGLEKSFQPAIQTIVSSWKGGAGGYSKPNWTVEGMQEAFSNARNDDTWALTGASGTLYFGKESMIVQQETIYQHWRYEGGKFSLLERSKYSDIYGWGSNHSSTIIEYPDYVTEHPYKDLDSHFAVLVATSTGWDNYRHQADVLAMYQMLKGFGYTDDQIILILEDDLGEDVRVTPDGENVRKGAVIDYKLSQLAPEDLKYIMSGQVSEKTPTVLQGTDGTNVFFFWSGHGAKNGVLKWGSQTLEEREFIRIFDWAEGHFRKMLTVMETCYAGSLASAVANFEDPTYGVLFLCAALPGETSHADLYDNSKGTYLSNGFTRAFRTALEGCPTLSIHDLYVQVAEHTTGSHACLYNSEYYGSIYRNDLEEFLIPKK